MVNKPPKLTVEQARATLKRKGWSYRAAAQQLDISLTHLAWVLTKRRVSRRLLTRIEELPTRKASTGGAR